MRDALAFLTLLPVGARDRAPGRGAVLMFPIVGAVVGGVWSAVGWGAARLWGSLAAAVLVLLADLFLTGALHLDAFADVADGLASRRRGEAAIAVMRDPAVGAIGAAALTVALLLRLSFLVVLIEASQWQRLVAAPVAARLGMVWLMARGRCTSDHSLASSLCAACSVPIGTAAGAVALAIAYASAGAVGLVSVVLAVLLAEALAVLFRQRFGALTGDSCGATGLAAEITSLAVLSAGLG